MLKRNENKKFITINSLIFWACNLIFNLGILNQETFANRFCMNNVKKFLLFLHVYPQLDVWCYQLLNSLLTLEEKMDLHHRNKFAEWEFLDFKFYFAQNFVL